ncbi:MAG TPA: DHA2 family efflux MFS transporter permease subunit [Mycobacteriales bacterium]|jgi:EmrB/QacA subfamily drug resistance transporter|nr:DHA2 family efflux MFS transporter permease subunit [Mycobacteriales bacterium]
MSERRRWIAFWVLCLGELMVVLDSTVVNVALPSIRKDLGFSEASLAWVVNGYLLTFGGCLLLGGRLGDLYGQRKVFVAGITGFTLASIGCGVSTSQAMLITFRAVQGVAGALATAVGFALVVTLFSDPEDRAKAMGISGFVASGGGAVGVLVGGVLTDTLGWHWVFLVNVPIGIAVCLLVLRLVGESSTAAIGGRLDVAGALVVTGGLMLAVNAVVKANDAGWASAQTLGELAGAGALLVAFVGIESRVAAPLVRLALFRSRNLAVSNAVGVLWAAGMFAWFFMAALYLQQVLGYSALEVGLAFLPGNLLMMACSVSLSARLVLRFGYRLPLGTGLALAAAGLGWFARAPLHGSFAVDVLPSMLLLGLGAGIAFNPVLLAAMDDVVPEESGIASGAVNTSFMMGGALGLAVLASIAASASHSRTTPAALLDGYQLAFGVGALLALAAAVAGYFGLRDRTPSEDGEPVERIEAGVLV